MDNKLPIESIMTTTMENIRDMVDVNTVIGDPVNTPDGSTVIPISRVSFGFVAGGGEYAAGETVTIKADTRDGFVFKGWLYNVSLDFVTGSASSSEASFVMPAENVTIEASYESIISYLTYTVTYDANGGVGVMSAQSTMIGMPVTLQGCAFVAPEGMRFKGWSLSPDGGELIEKVTSFTDVTVYAIWETVPVVTPPVTGDDAAIGLWLMLMLVSGAGAVYLVRRRKAN